MKQTMKSKLLKLRIPKDLLEDAKKTAKSRGLTLRDWLRSLLRAEAFNA